MAGEATPSSTSSGGSEQGGLGGKLVLILSAVNLLVTAGMLSLIIITFQREKHKPSVEDITTHSEGEGEKEGAAEGEGAKGEGEKNLLSLKKNTSYGRMVTLEQFTVNLSTPGSVAAKYVRVNMALEVSNEDIESEINARLPQVKNTIIDLFNSKRPADLVDVEGKEYLKEEIKNALNGFLVSGKIKNVFFTSFALAG